MQYICIGKAWPVSKVGNHPAVYKLRDRETLFSSMCSEAAVKV